VSSPLPRSISARREVSVGLAVFVAQIIKGLGLTNMQTGFATMIPYAAGTVGMIVWGHYSDKKNERRWNLTGSCTVMGLGCIIAALLTGSYWSVLGLSLITIGLYASNAHLFPLPSVFLTGPGIGNRDRLGQLRRHPGRQRVASGHGISPRLDRKFCGRALRACRVCCAGGNCRGGRRTRDTSKIQRGGASGCRGGVGRIRSASSGYVLHCPEGPLPAIRESSPGRERKPRAGERLPAEMMPPWERPR